MRLARLVAGGVAVVVVLVVSAVVAGPASALAPPTGLVATGQAWRPKPTASPQPTASATAGPAASPTVGPTVSSSPSPASCADGAPPVSYAGASYCPGYIFAVRRTLYGTNAKIVLRGVVVGSVSGTQVQISGGPSCLPTEWCGQTIPSMTVTFRTSTAVPAYGDVISLYGTTTTGGLTPIGFQTTGHCDPYWGDC